MRWDLVGHVLVRTEARVGICLDLQGCTIAWYVDHSLRASGTMTGRCCWKTLNRSMFLPLLLLTETQKSPS